MTSLAQGLPPEVAAAISEEWRANEAAYWVARPKLLATHNGEWIAFADDVVIAAGGSPVEILHAATASGRHPFVCRVGEELEPTRMRRIVWLQADFADGERILGRDVLNRLSVLFDGPTGEVVVNP